MFDTTIDTTVSIFGHIVFLQYKVNENWVLSWDLNYDVYDPDAYCDTGLQLLETFLRTHQWKEIREQLLDEFEARRYQHDEVMIEFAEDVPF